MCAFKEDNTYSINVNFSVLMILQDFRLCIASGTCQKKKIGNTATLKLFSKSENTCNATLLLQSEQGYL